MLDEVRDEERKRLFDELMKQWPKRYDTGRLSETPDDDLFYRLIGQNDARRSIRQLVEEVFGLSHIDWEKNRRKSK
jgi:hypothetical protein